MGNLFKAKGLASTAMASLAILMLAQNESGAKIIQENTDTAQINALANPIGERVGSEIDIRVPPGAHLSEIVIYYGETPDRVNGLQFYYQPDLDSRPVSTNFVGELKGKSFRIPVGWNDIVTGLETMTNTNGNLVAFKLKTTGGDKGYGSTEAFESRVRNFDEGLLFAGLRARASKNSVHALGILTVPASNAPSRASYNAKVIAQNASNAGSSPTRNFSSGNSSSVGSTNNRPSAPQQSGFERALEKFEAQVRQGQEDRARAETLANQKKQRQIATVSRPVQSAPTLGRGNAVILYEHCNYGGRAVALTAGAWNASRMARRGMPNNTVSSIKILNGYEIEASANDYARGGANKIFRSSVSCLVNHNFNDVISYARVRRHANNIRANPGTNSTNWPTNSRPNTVTSTRPTSSRPTTTVAAAPTNKSATTMDASRIRLGGNSHAILYSRCGYRGKAIGLHGGTWSVARLKQLGFEGQSVNSVKLLSGKQITLNTQGRKTTIKSNKSCLNYPVHARPRFTGFTVGTRSAIASGQAKPAGFKARSVDQLQWTPVGVNGNNVGAVYFEREETDPKTGQKITKIHRLEIAEEGSLKWRWFTNSYKRGREPLGKLVVLSRSQNTLYLRNELGGVDFYTQRMFIDLRSGKVTYQQRASLTSGKEADLNRFDFIWDGKITTKSRPK